MTTPAVLVDDPAPRVDPQALALAETEVSAIEVQAGELQILTVEDHDEACRLVTEWMGKEQEVRARLQLDEQCEAAHRSWKLSVAMRDKVAGAYERARRTLKAKIGAWREAERKRADEEARNLREAAQRAVEDEALARAQRLQDQGKPREAEAMLTIMPAAPVVSAAPPPAAQGVAARKAWSAEVLSLSALVAWVAQDLDGRVHYLLPAMPVLNAQAKALREAMNKEPAPIPGVRAVSRFC